MSEKKKEEKVELTLHQKIIAIQTTLKAPKSNFNSFGKYKYRSNENILEALKPHLEKHSLTLMQRDSIRELSGRVYIQCTSTLSDGEDSVENVALARESATKKGMDDSQITGTASSYARKYCLNGMFLLDDTKDADTMEYGKEGEKKASEANKAWHKCIDDWYARCQTKQEVVTMVDWILKKEGVAHYTEYIKEKGATLIKGMEDGK